MHLLKHPALCKKTYTDGKTTHNRVERRTSISHLVITRQPLTGHG